jgi:hypothetical protein
MSRHATILDVVEAVRRIAPAHPTVRSWWMVPHARLRVNARNDPGEANIEVAVECVPGAIADIVAIQAELRGLFPDDVVRVRLHGGAAEKLQLVRLLTSGPSATSAKGVAAHGSTKEP